MVRRSVKGWKFVPKQAVNKNTKQIRNGRVCVIDFIHEYERIIT